MDFNDNQNFSDIRKFIHVARERESRTQWKGQGLRWMFSQLEVQTDRGTTTVHWDLVVHMYNPIYSGCWGKESSTLPELQSNQTNSDSLPQEKKKNCKNRTEDVCVDCLGCLKSQFQCPVNRSMRSMGREREEKEKGKEAEGRVEEKEEEDHFHHFFIIFVEKLKQQVILGTSYPKILALHHNLLYCIFSPNFTYQ